MCNYDGVKYRSVINLKETKDLWAESPSQGDGAGISAPEFSANRISGNGMYPLH